MAPDDVAEVTVRFTTTADTLFGTPRTPATRKVTDLPAATRPGQILVSRNRVGSMAMARPAQLGTLRAGVATGDAWVFATACRYPARNVRPRYSIPAREKWVVSPTFRAQAIEGAKPVYATRSGVW
ncbi:hypothetical protein [Arthrobacter sp. MW3 TE3886]|uniref:hypothetical protein n=1 Tax=Arthrobacter sp. MW3 TE3886 TaxID=3156254 RepID=UPI00351294D4